MERLGLVLSMKRHRDLDAAAARRGSQLEAEQLRELEQQAAGLGIGLTCAPLRAAAVAGVRVMGSSLVWAEGMRRLTDLRAR